MTKHKWLGIHDHPDTAVKWLDDQVSYTWLRTFERAPDIETVAFLREPHYDRDIPNPIRNVTYRFRSTSLSEWIDAIAQEEPSLILYNLCDYAVGAKAMQRLRCLLPNTKHVLRIHHFVPYLAAQNGFIETVRSCDFAIAPTDGQRLPLQCLGFQGTPYALPFGVNVSAMKSYALPFEQRDIDLACATNSHPARNLEIVQQTLAILCSKGINAQNFTDLAPSELGRRFGRSKIFWQTSLTEASGSRVLPEAMAAGCYPLVFDECPTTRLLIQQHGYGIARHLQGLGGDKELLSRTGIYLC